MPLGVATGAGEARKKKEENAGRRMASKSGRLPLGAATLVSKAWPFFTSILYPSPTFLFHRSRDIFCSSPSLLNSTSIGAERTEVPSSSLRPPTYPNPTSHTHTHTPVPTVPLQRKIAAAIPCPSCFLYIYFSEHLTFLLLPALSGLGRIKPLSKKNRSRSAPAALHSSLLFTYYCLSFL
jgi:hypothetical protein